jgi:RNA 3'-terminal phosphate cyclase (ATP)
LIEIDGSQKSGSGTILRLAIALATIQGQPLHITNIRQNRPKAGLKPQHLEAVLTAAKLCQAETKGAVLGSRELWFTPHAVRGGEFMAQIGTAGSIPMLVMTVLPICLCSRKSIRLQIRQGGTDAKYAPTLNYLWNVLFPVLGKMGADIQMIVKRYGYYPKGNGEVILHVKPSGTLQPYRVDNFGEVRAIKGVSVCTFLANRQVAERQAKAASENLQKRGYYSEIQVINDKSNPVQKGSSIVLWAETDMGAIVGSDAIGELGKLAEKVGVEAAERLAAELDAKATADVHLSDMLIPYFALVTGSSSFKTRTITDHVESNVWLAETITSARFNVTRTDDLYRVEKQAES